MALRALNVWLNGQLVGRWSWTRTDVHTFSYADSWLQSPAVRPLSVSLPITAGAKEVKGPVVRNYFDNLLPDSDAIRERLRTRFNATSGKVQDLLAQLGRDCVGAVQLLPEELEPTGFDRIAGEPLDAAEVARYLRGVTSGTNFGQHEAQEDLRISIAGAQEKTAFLWQEGCWQRPLAATPTTHIFKLPLGLVANMRANMQDSVENEWLCMQIMAQLGFSVAHTEMANFDGQKVLIVERFDRRRMEDGKWIARLPQEDFCQATGTAPAHKYEGDGGPGIATCLDILGGSRQAAQDKLTFALANLAFWLLAAPDGHAKNYAIAMLPGAEYQMTPLYDILSAWPVIGDRADQIPLQRATLAMSLHGKSPHRKLQEIQTRHWQELAQQTGHPEAFSAMLNLVHTVPDALARIEPLLPVEFPEYIWLGIREGMLGQQRNFLLGLTA